MLNTFLKTLNPKQPTAVQQIMADRLEQHLGCPPIQTYNNEDFWSSKLPHLMDGEVAI
jgi:hypothetical protein